MSKNFKNKLKELPIISIIILSSISFATLFATFTTNVAGKCLGTIENCGWRVNAEIERAPLYEPSLSLALVLAIASILISIPLASMLRRGIEEFEFVDENAN